MFDKKAYMREYMRSYTLNNAVKLRTYRHSYNRTAARKEADRILAQIKRVENPEYHRQVSRAYYARNRDRVAAAISAWAKANPGNCAARCAKRRAAKLQATPPWLTEQHFADIGKFYAEAAKLQATDGIKRHVDHIYPLQGKTVCGLHVPWNLQILTAVDNRRKSVTY